MSPEEQRIKIAEVCGWRFVVNPVTQIGGYWENGQQGYEGYLRGDWGSRECAVGLPDYLNDLNAIHTAIVDKIGNHYELWSKFERELNDIMPHGKVWLPIWCADVNQLSQAFLRTLGLWKESRNPDT